MKYDKKRVEKHLFKGTATIYWWDGRAWRIQTKHQATMRVLHKQLHKSPYRPISSKEQLVFSVQDTDFPSIYKLMADTYRSVVVPITG